MNRAEVNIALAIYARLHTDFSHVDFAGKIGIVTPYKEQLRELLQQFRRVHGQEITNYVDFNTIDGFQGQEKDIIILSCVRASEEGGVGFLKDVRRINVALTRAKSTLFILGNKRSLVWNEFWKELVVDAESRGVLVDCGPQTFARSTVVPVVPQIQQTTGSTNGAPKKATAKPKTKHPVGELIPLGKSKVKEKKKSWVKVDSDIEMRNADSSEDSSSSSSDESDSESSDEEGEIHDVEMPDAVLDIPKVKPHKPATSSNHTSSKPTPKGSSRAPKSSPVEAKPVSKKPAEKITPKRPADTTMKKPIERKDSVKVNTHQQV